MTEQLWCISKPYETQEEAQACVPKLCEELAQEANKRGWTHVGHPPLYTPGVYSSDLHNGVRVVTMWSEWVPNDNPGLRVGWVVRADALYEPTVDVLLAAAP